MRENVRAKEKKKIVLVNLQAALTSLVYEQKFHIAPSSLVNNQKSVRGLVFQSASANSYCNERFLTLDY